MLFSPKLCFFLQKGGFYHVFFFFEPTMRTETTLGGKKKLTHRNLPKVLEKSSNFVSAEV